MKTAPFAARAVCWSTALLLIGALSSIAQDEQESEYTIHLRSRSFIPKPLPAGSTHSVAGQDGGPKNVILQFKTELTPADRADFARDGVLLHEWLGGRAYSATLPKTSPVTKMADHGNIRAKVSFLPDDKISPFLAKDSVPAWARVENSSRVRVQVQFFPNVPPERVRELIKGESPDGPVQLGPNNTWATTVDPADIKPLAEREEVRSIEPGPLPMIPLDAGARALTHADVVQQLVIGNPVITYQGDAGAGMRIGIHDLGLNGTHPAFARLDGHGAPAGSRVRVPHPASSLHGTHVASIAAGNGVGSACFWLRGFAPEAELGGYSFDNFAHGNLDLFAKSLQEDGMDVTNHSYTQGLLGYGQNEQTIDSYIRGDALDGKGMPIPARPQVWAAGNSGMKPLKNAFGKALSRTTGYYAVYTQAKNTISVGSIDTIDGHLSAFSSLGPTFDGRIKPDLVAPGAVDSCQDPPLGILAAGGTAGYVAEAGTSMAAPAVSGTIALMKQRLIRVQPGHPGKELRPSTYRAILIHGARDLVHDRPCCDPAREVHNPDTKAPILYHQGPDFATGFGLLDTRASCDLIAHTDRWREGEFRTTDETEHVPLTVASGETELKVVLAWDDPPAQSTPDLTRPLLVNDLDLVVIDPEGQEHQPWVLDPPPIASDPLSGDDPIQPDDIKPAYRGVDRRNNVEMVTVESPKPGRWEIRIRSFLLARGSVQPYSIASSAPLAD